MLLVLLSLTRFSNNFSFGEGRANIHVTCIITMQRNLGKAAFQTFLAYLSADGKGHRRPRFQSDALFSDWRKKKRQL